ncbi:MAG TPA: CNNM domain-containing protein [Candidatus Paceibacterota bacterium]|nr:CNNM domain-containing protein [Candidatus Paceibacterota bacterium]
MNGTPLTWVVLAGCLALSFFLSGMEAGVFALSRIRIRQQMRAGRVSAKLLLDYLEHPENFLWTIFVGNTAANFFILGWAIFVLHDYVHERRVWFVVVFCAFVFLFYTLFDLLPKMLFRLYPNRLCLFLARPFRFVHLLLRPLVWLVEGVSAALLHLTGAKALTRHVFGNREELRFIMQESAQALSTEERTMINQVLDLQSATVRQITRPLERVTTAEAEWPVSRVLDECRKHHFTRVPVWERREGARRISGLVSLNALLFLPAIDPAQPLAKFVRPAIYLDEDLRLEVALRQMQRSGQRMAIVLSRDRREIGIVTLEDILKAVFGEVNL